MSAEAVAEQPRRNSQSSRVLDSHGFPTWPRVEDGWLALELRRPLVTLRPAGSPRGRRPACPTSAPGPGSSRRSSRPWWSGLCDPPSPWPRQGTRRIDSRSHDPLTVTGGGKTAVLGARNGARTRRVRRATGATASTVGSSDHWCPAHRGCWGDVSAPGPSSASVREQPHHGFAGSSLILGADDSQLSVVSPPMQLSVPSSRSTASPADVAAPRSVMKPRSLLAGDATGTAAGHAVPMSAPFSVLGIGFEQ